jgi:DNA-binding IclR family transcriptional regulator
VAVEDVELRDGRGVLAAVVADTDEEPIAAVELTVPVPAYTRKELAEQFGSKVTVTAHRIAPALARPVKKSSKGARE